MGRNRRPDKKKGQTEPVRNVRGWTSIAPVPPALPLAPLAAPVLSRVPCRAVPCGGAARGQGAAEGVQLLQAAAGASCVSDCLGRRGDEPPIVTG